jgi:hypothetical protein
LVHLTWRINLNFRVGDDETSDYWLSLLHFRWSNSRQSVCSTLL